MSTSIQQPFVDFYDVLQISRSADPDTVHRVYRILAAKVHPDNPKTGDLDSFVLLNRAYEVLANPDTRSAYDAEYSKAGAREHEAADVDARHYAVGLDGESNRRLNILCLLYRRRRSNAENPGVSLLDMEAAMGTPREDLLFAIWYLKEKEYVRLDDRSSFIITATGVDHIEKNLPSKTIVQKLLREAAKP